MELEFDQVREMIDLRLKEQSSPSKTSEEAFIELIALRVAELMESNMELFINHLYRMDIDERRVNRILLMSSNTDESVYLLFARLIYQRQRERLETKKKYKQDDTDFWAED